MLLLKAHGQCLLTVLILLMALLPARALDEETCNQPGGCRNAAIDHPEWLHFSSARRPAFLIDERRDMPLAAIEQPLHQSTMFAQGRPLGALISGITPGATYAVQFLINKGNFAQGRPVAPALAQSAEMHFDLVLPQLDEGEHLIEFIVWDEA